MESYIKTQISTNAPERGMTTIVNKKYFSEKEKLTRPLLTSLIQKSPHTALFNVNAAELLKDSNIRRNGVLIEDILRKREKEKWYADMSAVVHERQRAQETSKKQWLIKTEDGDEVLF
jgi:hypothetical protein